MQTLSPLSLVLISLLFWAPTETYAQSSLDEFSELAELLQQYSNLGSTSGFDASFFDSLSNEDILSLNETPPSLSYSPKSIKPGDRVTVSIHMPATSLDFLLINWYVDGSLFSSGVGIKSIALNAGAVGTATTVYAEITESSGSVKRTAPVVLGASHVDILWEAVDAKTPPFYRGKALPSWDTIVKAYAVPQVYNAEGRQAPASTFVYTWKKNQRAADLSPQSGYGKDNVYVLADFARRQHLVSADISHTGLGSSSYGSVSIKLHDPETLLYEKHPLQGIIFERVLPAVVTQSVSSGSIRVVVYPFGIDSGKRTDISHTWKLNGRTLNNSGLMSAGEIPLTASNSRGASTISVITRNEAKPLQTTSGLLRINVE